MAGPASADPGQIAQSIAAALARLPALRPRWIRSPPGRRPPQRAVATGRPRLTIVVSGVRRVLAQTDGEPRIHELRPGDALVVPPHGWSMPVGDAANRIVAINCHDGGTHFESPSGPDPSRAMFVSGGPLNPLAWALLTGLVHLGGREELHGHGDQLLRLAVSAALLDCRPWPGGDQALRTWSRARAFATERLDSGRAALARAAGVHPNHLSRLCRRMEGTSLIAWLTGLRMERARVLLAAGMPVAMVSRACGYGDPGHFRRVFRGVHGLPPLAWLGSAR